MKIIELRKSIAEDEKAGRQDHIFWNKVLILQLSYLNKKLDEVTKKMDAFCFDHDGCLYTTKGEHH